MSNSKIGNFKKGDRVRIRSDIKDLMGGKTVARRGAFATIVHIEKALSYPIILQMKKDGTRFQVLAEEIEMWKRNGDKWQQWEGS